MLGKAPCDQRQLAIGGPLICQNILAANQMRCSPQPVSVLRCDQLFWFLWSILRFGILPWITAMNPNESHPFPFYPPVQPSLPGAVGPMQPTYSYPSVFVPPGQAMYPFQLAQDELHPVQIPAAHLSTSSIPSVAQNTADHSTVLPIAQPFCRMTLPFCRMTLPFRRSLYRFAE